MTDLPVVDLMKPLPNGLPAVSCYTEFRKLTGQPDNGETFQAWLLAAATLMDFPQMPAGHS